MSIRKIYLFRINWMWFDLWILKKYENIEIYPAPYTKKDSQFLVWVNGFFKEIKQDRRVCKIYKRYQAIVSDSSWNWQTYACCICLRWPRFLITAVSGSKKALFLRKKDHAWILVVRVLLPHMIMKSEFTQDWISVLGPDPRVVLKPSVAAGPQMVKRSLEAPSLWKNAWPAFRWMIPMWPA